MRSDASQRQSQSQGVRTSDSGPPWRPLPGAFDEMATPDGRLRPAYRPVMEALGELTRPEREARFATAEQYLREAGVYYRAGEDGGARLWPLAFPPFVIDPGEWRTLERALVQRATYLERLIADLYGPRSLVREGVLPARLLGHNPEFLRPLANQGLSGKSLVRFIAVDLGRGPDGSWRVLGDRAQAPSGAGFALENRVATARALPDLARQLHLRRLAGFFARFREALEALNDQEGARIGLLTPGPFNETYFEHAYLARYLGFHLLEGGDLVVQGDEAKLRTVEGLKPVSVLWRRLDADYADPLELLSQSRIGTPGLLRAVRAGHLDLVNALGSGILETPAFAAFEGAMAERLLGERLALPSVDTLWCGDAGGHAEARSDGDWKLGPAFPGQAGLSPSDLDLPCTPDDAVHLVARRVPPLSCVPMESDGVFVARPVTLRVFLSQSATGWEVMPGGFARASNAPGDAVPAIGTGGRSMDVWIPGDEPDAPITLLSPGNTFRRRLPGSLPARAADNLFWLGRSAERTEIAIRLWRATLERGAEERETPVDVARRALLTRSGVTADDPLAGLHRIARSAFDIASRIRDRFSPDAWRVLAEVADLLGEARREAAPVDHPSLAGRLLTRLAGFSGLVEENMYQFSGWRFLQCGRRIERGEGTAAACADFLAAGGEGVLEALLEFTDSRLTYRRRFSVELQGETVLDLGILDPLNPRSVAYQVAAVRRTMADLPGIHAGESLDGGARRIARLDVRLETATPAEVTPAFLRRVAQDLRDISDLLSERYFAVAPEGAIERFGSE
ncbi:circularly permuted type 2 ATP-grasp protein [Aureimonas sp. SK2]|uniref:circularly permuted type 2 ATP-grasp protein n=1 Tax=Aureimonas sp. SK2 TaxID=3015992 RepID=UPI002443BE64|nr:circularly permuted type 2 ATP-grasp protein [Aureimonas sp. SK2]